jgi:regulator of replication initiation timing
MMNENNNAKGYVYILEVKDIDLPVCKIGMTSRTPHARCSEINNNSTGDFIWQVAHQVAVNNCQKLESLVHNKLAPLRQKNREFFNINAEVAYKALRSIMENQHEIMEITVEESDKSNEVDTKTEKKKSKRASIFKNIDSEYTELLQLFTSTFHIKGRPFGQLNKPSFGMSDGNEGVQWNLTIFTDTNRIQLGVNLEGMKYSDWPIATFILSELESPSIEKLKTKLEQPEDIFIQFRRDAWQVNSRPDIVEQYCGASKISIAEITPERWIAILTEALGCLNEQKQYRGRNNQSVTLVSKLKGREQIRTMEVSPHLTIWTRIVLSEDISSNLERGIVQLKPVHEWASRVSQVG